MSVFLKFATNILVVFKKGGPAESILNDSLTSILTYIIYIVSCQAVVFFGIGSNIANIICFRKQGFKDPINISLMGLAIADLGCLTTLMGNNIFLTPALSDADLPFDCSEVAYITTGMFHVTFTRFSAWITALITLERCLCITIPIKVKTIVTPQRVAFLLTCVFIILLASVSPMYVVNRLAMTYNPKRNKTVLGLVYKEDRETVEMYSYAINNVLVPFSAFVVIIVCTITLVVKLEKASKWRSESTSAQCENVSSRNQKAATMVLMISTLFIVCFIPVTFICIAMTLVPEFSFTGSEKNLLYTIGGLAVILESINSSSNIFIYYRMSSNYRRVFQQLFHRSENT